MKAKNKRSSWRTWFGLVLVLSMTILSAGCQTSRIPEEAGNQDRQNEEKFGEYNENNKEDTDNTNKNMDETSANKVSCIDGDGNRIEVTKNPKRTVVINNSMLDIWYLAGGTAVGRADSSNLTNVPREAVEIETVGHVSQPNTEKVLSLEPDLVILSSTMENHRALKDILDQNGIENIMLRYENYKDFGEILDLFGQINNDKDIIQETIPEIKEEVQEIIYQYSVYRSPKVLILFASARSVQCETTSAHVGYMINMLGGINIAGDPPREGQNRIQFSMEKIIEQDPDIILVATMGDMEAIEERMEQDITSNQAWAGLRAVKEGNVYYLPSEFFLNKPNTQYPEAFKYLAELLYTEESEQ